MRAYLRLSLLAILVALPFGATANAAPLLTSAVLTFSDGAGSLGPFTVDVTAGQSPEFCGTDVVPDDSCAGTTLTTEGVLLEDDFIDFTGTSILFAFRGGGQPLPDDPTYLDLNLPGGTFTITGLVISEGGALSGVTPVLTNVAGLAAGDVTFTATSITFKVESLGVLQDTLGQVRLDLSFRNGTEPPPPPVPEPASMLLLGSGLAVAGFVRRRRSVR